MRWIKYKNRFPDKNGNYLVVVNVIDIFIAYYKDGVWLHGYYNNTIHPSHWTHLPKMPPKGECYELLR